MRNKNGCLLPLLTVLVFGIAVLMAVALLVGAADPTFPW